MNLKVDLSRLCPVRKLPVNVFLIDVAGEQQPHLPVCAERRCLHIIAVILICCGHL
jgi:hypothetical protein